MKSDSKAQGLVLSLPRGPNLFIISEAPLLPNYFSPSTVAWPRASSSTAQTAAASSVQLSTHPAHSRSL